MEDIHDLIKSAERRSKAHQLGIDSHKLLLALVDSEAAILWEIVNTEDAPEFNAIVDAKMEGRLEGLQYAYGILETAGLFGKQD